MGGWRAWLIVVGFLQTLALGVSAEPLARKDVPEPLEAWVGWVLHEAKDATCPFVQGMPDRRQCVWPSRLALTLDEAGGTFRQEWRVYAPHWVPLPGHAEAWPQRIRIDGARAVVVSRQGVPSVRLEPGRYVITGAYDWPSLPEFLRIPNETGLISLRVRRRPVSFPNRDLQGRLWLQKPAEDRAGESRLDVVVHRRVVDEVPLRLDTNVELKVAGKSREVLLARALPEGFIPMSLQSALPARIEPDARLRVQVRPGTWQLVLSARHDGPVSELRLLESSGTWDPEEVWVFEARNHLRLVHVEGVPGIDPQRTTLPDDWKPLPAYLMEPGSRMVLVEKRRGDSDPAPDQLSLTRTWWLDFDGGGYSVHDQIAGRLSQSWRLEMAAPTALGRVAIQGQDQFISRLDDAGLVGVEVRQGQVNVDADSRLDGLRGRIPAVGWNHDFQQVSGQLNLPPGWRLLHATGVDDIRSTWTTRWSLLDIFLVLITAMIVAQLWGWAWGGLALVTLALVYPEAGAPRWSWLAILAAQALVRVAPQGRLLRFAQLARVGAVALLAVVVVPFAVQQARHALYPALEFPYLAVRGAEAKAAGMVESVLAQEGALERDALEELRSMDRPSAAPEPKRGRVSRYYAPDPLALVSTGPGLPHWGWRTIQLGWRGPVERDQQIRVVLIPPWANLVIAFARIVLVALLVLCVLGLGGRLRGWLERARGGRTALVAGLALTGVLAPRPATADIPSPELLKELRERLLETPECFPECASSPRLRLEVTPSVLRARVEIDAAWETAVPLPGGAQQWVPETVLQNGQPAEGLARSPDGRLWLRVAAGKHQVSLEGRLPERDSVEIALPLKPNHVEADVRGWVLVGVREGGIAEHSLQLSRVRKENERGVTLEPSDLPPFVRVERTLSLGLAWQLETRAVRVTPTGKALFLEVPLLAGESVTSEGIEVADGKAQASIPARATSVHWTSVLAETDRVALHAPDAVPWTELWRLDAAPVWHVDASGIPVVHQPSPGQVRIREWRPWPGEEVQLRISRPASVDGRTLTIDRSTLRIDPGLRASGATLDLSLRASRGVQHAVALPEGADLQSVKINDELQPIRPIDGRVILPIRPGKHTAEVAWRTAQGIASRYETSAIGLGGPSVNSEIEVHVPRDRWILFVGGPRMGPAVLFWSVLLVAVLIAAGLGRVPFTPLRWRSWLLLLVGLTQVPIWISLVVAGWLVALGWRRQNAAAASDGAFNLLQLLLVFWTGAALLCLVWAIRQGLLGLPDMQIAGNGSSGQLLRWYQDRAAESTPTSWLISVPLFVYRLAMLAWALWLATALVGWLRWGWQCFTESGIWRPRRRRPRGSPRAEPAEQPTQS